MESVITQTHSLCLIVSFVAIKHTPSVKKIILLIPLIYTVTFLAEQNMQVFLESKIYLMFREHFVHL